MSLYVQQEAVPAVSLAVRPHPLDQLSPEEIKRASSACNAYAFEHGVGKLRFNTVMLQANTSIQAIVALDGAHADKVVSWNLLEGVHPMTTPDDNFYAEEIVKKDRRIHHLLQERYGVTDIGQLVVDTWACHGAPEHLNHRRLMQGFLYLKTSPNDNEYAHPLDMVPIVDLNTAEVVHIDMLERAPPVPLLNVNYHRELQEKPWRTDLKPLHVIQPQGPSFTVQGSLVKWQNWQLRLGFNAREGLVLHNVGYMDQGRLRPVLYRASLAEMAVPYGDPNYIMTRKCAMDSGDYGFGLSCNSLQLGCDCLGHIKYFDAFLNNSAGEPVVIRKAVCLHEEDAGILFKHFDCRTGHVEVRRARKLVVNTISTFMNYEYVMNWSFWQDGSIHFEMKLTGILSTSVAPLEEGDKPKYGVRVAPGVNATAHQHFFCMRIDPAVDDYEGGKGLVVSEVEAERVPQGVDNPADNAFFMKETDLTNTTVAQRMTNFDTARCWKLKNPCMVNPITKEPVAYKLIPAPGAAMMAGPNSLVYKRARFATKNLWVTPYQDDQKYPAGEHVVQSKECLGLAEWTREEQPLLGADPVCWYSFGLTHAPRIEDFPIMPVEMIGFALKPCGFFTWNPAIDLPPECNSMSREVGVPAAAAAECGSGSGCCQPMSKL